VTANLDVVQDADLSEDSCSVRESDISSHLTQYQFPILKTLERGDDRDISISSSNPDVIVPAFEFPKHEEKARPFDFHFPIHDTSPKRIDIRKIPANVIPEISSQYEFPTLETPPRRIDLSISMIKRHMSNTLSSSQKEEIDQSSTSSSTLVRLKVREESSPRQQESDDQSSFTGSTGTSETSSSYSSGINNPWITPRRLVNFQNLATDDTLLNTVDKSLIEKLKELRMQYRLIE